MSDYLLVRDAIPLVKLEPEGLSELADQLVALRHWQQLKDYVDKWYPEGVKTVEISYIWEDNDDGTYTKRVGHIAAYASWSSKVWLRPEKDATVLRRNRSEGYNRDLENEILELESEWFDDTVGLEAYYPPHCLISLDQPYKIPDVYMESLL